MELFLDSANLKDIQEAFTLGILDGLTTTPTFMRREGVTDIDGTIVKLSKMVPVLMIEALGNTSEEVIKEAERLLALGLDPQKTVFKIPVSVEGVKACALLRKKGYLVNLHLIYTLQQAYMAMQADATYACVLVGRLQDQGHDALTLVEECMNAIKTYGYNTKIMFSSVRNAEHVRNAINLGVHNITLPYKILKQLTENNFTKVGHEQFITDTRLMTVKVKDAIKGTNPIVDADTKLSDAIIKMTEYGYGCITILNNDGSIRGVFTDGDLRRALPNSGKDLLNKKMSDFKYRTPVSVDEDALLNEAVTIFNKTKVDTILVLSDGKPVGMLDIQDIKAK